MLNSTRIIDVGIAIQCCLGERVRIQLGSGFSGFGWLPNWLFLGKVKALHLAEKNVFPLGVPQGGNHWWHTQKHHTRIRKTTKGDFEANIWTSVRHKFQNVG